MSPMSEISPLKSSMFPYQKTKAQCFSLKWLSLDLQSYFTYFFAPFVILLWVFLTLLNPQLHIFILLWTQLSNSIYLYSPLLLFHNNWLLIFSICALTNSYICLLDLISFYQNHFQIPSIIKNNYFFLVSISDKNIS
jgi:hypothetical protein